MSTSHKTSLHVCLISEELPPDTGWGGIGTYTYNLAMGLKEIGHKISVVSRSIGTKESFKSIKGINVYRIKSSISDINDPNEINAYRYRVYQKIKEINNNFPIDIIESPEWKAETAFLLIDTERTIPVVLRLHSTLSLIKKINNIKDIANEGYIQELLEKFAIENADLVYSSSKSLIEIIKHDYHIKRKDIFAQFNPANIIDFSPKKHLAADIRLIKKNSSIIMYVGRIEKRKGVDQIIKTIPSIVKQHPNAKFVFIGRDTNILVKNKYKSFTKKLLSNINKKYHKHVFFLGFREYINLPNYYPAADIAIFPSYYENFPAVCLEAMASGCAVIGSKNGGMSEIIEHFKSGMLVNPYSIKDIKQSLLLLLNDKSLRDKIRFAATKRILKFFDRKNIALKSERIYLRAIKKFISKTAINK